MLISLSLHVRGLYTSLTWTLGSLDDEEETPATESEILSDTQIAEPEPEPEDDEQHRQTVGFRRTDQ